jgi:hypothetical protein
MIMPTSFKLVGVGLLLAFVGFFMSQKQLRLKFWGRNANANVTKVYETQGRRGKRGVRVEFNFVDESGKSHNAGEDVSIDYRPPGDGTVPIVYLSSDPTVYQLAYKSGTFAYLIFIGGIGLIAGGVWYFNRETVVEAHRTMTRGRYD